MTTSQPAPLSPDTPAPTVTEGDVRALLRKHGGYMGGPGEGWRCWCGDDLRPFWPAGGVTVRDSALNAALREHVTTALLASLDAARVEVAGLVERVRVVEGERDAARRQIRDREANGAEKRAESAEAAHAKALAVTEGIAYEHAATVDGEWGCCHDEDALRAGGRVPEFDGEEFEPIPDDCLGKQTLDRHLRLLAESTGAGR